MSDTHSQNSQAKIQPKLTASQLADAASLRRSKRPKTPSLLYADGFEDTQKVIGRKGNPKVFRTSSKNAGDNLSTSEKDTDTKMEEELNERVPSYADKLEDEDDDEYLPFVKPDEMEQDQDDRIGFVTFKLQGTEENKSSQRKFKKKTPYGEDFAYGIDAKKPKDNKVKVQVKRPKPIAKPVPAPPSTQDFLDIVLSAAIKAQASQNANDTTPTPKSPRTGYISATNAHMSGKVSAPKFGGLEDKPIGIIKKTKPSVKKNEPVKAYNATNDEFYQRHLEYKDHYIKEAVVEGDEVVLKHSKINTPITMKYHKQKFNLRKKSLVNSKIFDAVAGKEPTMEEENDENKEGGRDDSDWKKKLANKEQLLAQHFKEMLKDYKPSIIA